MIWIIFVDSWVIVGLYVAGIIFNWGWVGEYWYSVMMLGLPVCGVLLHSRVVFSWPRGLIFLALASFLGFLSEVVSMRWGVIFGGTYVYQMKHQGVLGVPWPVVAYWGLFIYNGYWLVESAARRLKQKIPVLVKVGLVAVAVTILDLVMDPVMVKRGLWIWLGGGDFYGVPWGNFIGWFGVSAMAVGIFMIVDGYLLKKDVDTSFPMMLIPVLSYGGIGLVLGLMAIQQNLTILGYSGAITMLSLTWINLRLTKRNIIGV